MLRDFLLYAARQRIVTITWSPKILREVTQQLRFQISQWPLSRTLDWTSSLPDALLTHLIREYEPYMLAAHRATVALAGPRKLIHSVCESFVGGAGSSVDR